MDFESFVKNARAHPSWAIPISSSTSGTFWWRRRVRQRPSSPSSMPPCVGP